MKTWGVVEVAEMTDWPGEAGAPRVAEMAVTRAAVGKNTTCPRDKVPFCVIPRCAWSFSTATLVQKENSSEPEGISALVA